MTVNINNNANSSLFMFMNVYYDISLIKCYIALYMYYCILQYNVKQVLLLCHIQYIIY